MARYDRGPTWTEAESAPHSGWDSDVTYAESVSGRMRRDIERVQSNPHVRDHLSEKERIRVGTRQHAIVLSWPVLATLATFAIFIYMVTHDGTVLLAFMVFLACTIWFLWRWISWTRNYFLATDHRVMKMYGVLSTTVDSMKVQKVTDMTYRRGLWGEILGFGSITIESAGQDQALHDIKYIPYPRENYQELCHIIIGDDPRGGGKKKHRLLRQIERLMHNRYAPPADHPDDSYPVYDHVAASRGTGPYDAVVESSPRMLYSSQDGRRADTSPIPLYPPGHFTGEAATEHDPADHSDEYFGDADDDITPGHHDDRSSDDDRWNHDGGDYPDPTRP